MNSFKFPLYLFVIGLCSVIISCSDSDAFLPPVDNIPEPSTKVFSTLYGIVQDEDAQPLEGVIVSIDDEIFETDENGYFKLEGFFNSGGAFIRASKEGYFDGAGMVIPYLDTSVGANMTLVRKDVEDRGPSSNRIVYEQNGVTVELSENAYSIDGTNYSGNVYVAAELHSPSDAEFNTIFPGFMSAGRSGTTRILDGYAVLNFELFDDSGNAIDITSPAKVSIPIDPAKLSEAPNQIAMWYLETETGLWIQEGVAILNGEKYEAEVSHFTMWCPATDYEVFTLSGNVNRDGASYADAIIGISYGSWRVPFRGAADGSYSVYVAHDFDFILDARNRCGEELYSNSFSSSVSDIMHDVDIIAPIDNIVISGEVTCPPDNAVSSTYVHISFGAWYSHVVLPDATGQFEYSFEDCDNIEISVSAYDQLNGTRSESQIITGSTTNLSLNVCEEELLGSMTIEMEGEEPYVVPDCRLTSRTELTQPFLGVNYRLEALDNYNGSNEFSDYFWIDITINHPDAESPNPTGPAIQPNMSANVPFYYRFDPADPILIEENDEVVKIMVTPNFYITRFENGVETTKPGTVTFVALKP